MLSGPDIKGSNENTGQEDRWVRWSCVAAQTPMTVAGSCRRSQGTLPSSSQICHTHPIFLQVQACPTCQRPEDQCGPQCSSCHSEYPPAPLRPPVSPLGHKQLLSVAYLVGWAEVVVVGSGSVGKLACWGVWKKAVPLETGSGRMVAAVGPQAPSVGSSWVSGGQAPG